MRAHARVPHARHHHEARLGGGQGRREGRFRRVAAIAVEELVAEGAGHPLGRTRELGVVVDGQAKGQEKGPHRPRRVVHRRLTCRYVDGETPRATRCRGICPRNAPGTQLPAWSRRQCMTEARGIARGPPRGVAFVVPGAPHPHRPRVWSPPRERHQAPRREPPRHRHHPRRRGRLHRARSALRRARRRPHGHHGPGRPRRPHRRHPGRPSGRANLSRCRRRAPHRPRPSRAPGCPRPTAPP